MRILKENTAAVIIDMQERLYPHMYGKEDLLSRMVTLLQGLRQFSVPLVVTQQYTRGLGDTIAPVREAIDDFSYLEKTAFSCHDEPSFREALACTGKKFVVIAGIEAHVCVLQTVLDLLEDAYVPVLVEDCISSRREHDKAVSVERMRSEGAVVTTCESLLFELCRSAGTEVFRNISRLVK